ncbi:MAG: DUF2878 domain-containing protein [Xanthomonadaceae bacterium]|jgi:hypothetical protein|nr:DUF2878 domain-containing protein [Xanthomonadaceae bacterium]
MRVRFPLLNFLGFQIVWLAAAWGAGQGLPWLGPTALLVFAVLHLAATPSPARDLRMLAIALPLGIVVDSTFALAGWLDFASPWPWPSLAPVWILAMWLGFALTLHHSMAFLDGRPLAAALLGLVGGPLAYWGAARGFDAVELTAAPLLVYAALALAWALALPLLYHLEAHWARRMPPAGATV